MIPYTKEEERGRRATEDGKATRCRGLTLHLLPGKLGSFVKHKKLSNFG